MANDKYGKREKILIQKVDGRRKFCVHTRIDLLIGSQRSYEVLLVYQEVTHGSDKPWI